MKTSLIKKLCCPQDKHDLDIKVFEKKDNEDILAGLLICPKCKRYYPIIYGVPIMTPDEYREQALEAPMLKKWGLQMARQEGQFSLFSATKEK